MPILRTLVDGLDEAFLRYKQRACVANKLKCTLHCGCSGYNSHSPTREGDQEDLPTPRGRRRPPSQYGGVGVSGLPS